MAWFNRNEKPIGQTELSHDNRVEIIVHKEATKEMVEKAIQANENLNELLLENGFTIKIFLAAGGKTKRKMAH